MASVPWFGPVVSTCALGPSPAPLEHFYAPGNRVATYALTEIKCFPERQTYALKNRDYRQSRSSGGPTRIRTWNQGIMSLLLKP